MLNNNLVKLINSQFSNMSLQDVKLFFVEDIKLN